MEGNLKRQYKVIQSFWNIPVGTILIKSQQDVGYEDLTPYWAYSYQYKINNQWVFGEISLRDVSRFLDYVEEYG